MHRFPSRSVIIRFKFAAFLHCLGAMMIPLVIGTLVYSIMTDDPALTKIGIILIGLTVLLAILKFLIGPRTRCPLCMTPVLASKGCSKHRHARTLFGSYRLRVAVAIVFRNSFKCPYCNESSELEVRTRRHRSGSQHF
ncbi:MAG: hypothetical protein ACRCXD_08820 [Luteolibacter sp.]